MSIDNEVYVYLGEWTGMDSKRLKLFTFDQTKDDLSHS